MAPHARLEGLDLGAVLLRAAARREALDVGLGRVDLRAEAVRRVAEPGARAPPGRLVRVDARLAREALLRVRLGLGLLLADLELLHLRLDELPRRRERALVLDLRGRQPGLRRA